MPVNLDSLLHRRKEEKKEREEDSKRGRSWGEGGGRGGERSRERESARASSSKGRRQGERERERVAETASCFFREEIAAWRGQTEEAKATESLLEILVLSTVAKLQKGPSNTQEF